MSNRRNTARRLAIVLVLLLLTGTCWGQVAPSREFNTASAGVREADVEAAVRAICQPHDIARSKDGTVSGCCVCPKGTDFFGDGHSHWGIYAESPGHFTSPEDDNLLLDGTGCDSHASNFGGSYMFTLKSGAARLLKYDQGLVTEQCHKFAFPDGRDFLICRGGSTFQGESNETIFMASFDASGKVITTKLISAMDTAKTCLGDIKFSSAESGTSETPEKSAQITELTITAMQGTTDCAAPQNDAKAGKLQRNVKSFRIEFLFDGKHFTVAPASRPALSRFDAN